MRGKNKVCAWVIKTPHWDKRGKEHGFDLEVYNIGPNRKKVFKQTGTI